MSCTSSMRSGPGTGTARNRSPGECPDVEVREDMEEKILLVEDEEKLARMVELELRYEGYEVEKAFDGRTGLERALSGEHDLILLDIMLPALSGMEVLRRLRRESQLPVIMLTARDTVVDKVSGLDSGADDYITKPFGVMELISRVKALLRRIDRVKKEDLNYGTIRIDVSRHTVQVDGNEVELTYKEYEILKYLMKNRGIVLTRDSLMEKIWGYDFEHGNRTVDVHIQSLRKKLGTAGDAIKTIRNVGYKIGD